MKRGVMPDRAAPAKRTIGAVSTRTLLWLLIAGVAAGTAWWWTRRPAPVVNSPPRAGPIMAFGDSLTYGVGASPASPNPEPGASYPDQLSRLIGRPVVNRGYPGDTIAEAAGRLDRDVLAENPSIVIVLLGGNDFLQRKELGESFRQLERIIRRIQDSGAMVVLVGLNGLTPLSGLAGEFRTLARRAGAVFVPNILGGIIGRPALMADSVHPNRDGYAIIAERIADALRPYLRR